MQDISEFIYGDEYVARNKAFDEAMANIKERHAEYFKSRKPANETETHNWLHNHYALRTASSQVSFTFNQRSD